jgi:hypothetical protein
MKQADVEEGKRTGLTDDERKRCERPTSGSGCWTGDDVVLRVTANLFLDQPARYSLLAFREMAVTGARIRVLAAVACTLLGLTTREAAPPLSVSVYDQARHTGWSGNPLALLKTPASSAPRARGFTTNKRPMPIERDAGHPRRQDRQTRRSALHGLPIHAF